jgi:plastocyanin
MKKLIITILIALSLTTSLAACSGGSSGGPPSTTLSVTLTEFSFDPSTFTVPAGKEITLTLINTGSVEHSFVILKKGYAFTSPYNDNDKANTLQAFTVQAGETRTVTFTSPAEPGEYQVICDIAGHAEAGMEARLIVK